MKHFDSVLLKNTNFKRLKSTKAKRLSHYLLLSLCFLTSHYSYGMKVDMTDRVKSILNKKIESFKKQESIQTLVKKVNITLADIKRTSSNLDELNQMIHEIDEKKTNNMTLEQKTQFLAHTFIPAVADIEETLIAKQPSLGSKSEYDSDDEILYPSCPKQFLPLFKTHSEKRTSGELRATKLKRQHKPMSAEETDQLVYNALNQANRKNDTLMQLVTHLLHNHDAEEIEQMFTNLSHNHDAEEEEQKQELDESVSDISFCESDKSLPRFQHQFSTSSQLSNSTTKFNLIEFDEPYTLNYPAHILQEKITTALYSNYWFNTDIHKHPELYTVTRSPSESFDEYQSESENEDTNYTSSIKKIFAMHREDEDDDEVEVEEGSLSKLGYACGSEIYQNLMSVKSGYDYQPGSETILNQDDSDSLQCFKTPEERLRGLHSLLQLAPYASQCREACNNAIESILEINKSLYILIVESQDGMELSNDKDDEEIYNRPEITRDCLPLCERTFEASHKLYQSAGDLFTSLSRCFGGRAVNFVDFNNHDENPALQTNESENSLNFIQRWCQVEKRLAWLNITGADWQPSIGYDEREFVKNSIKNPTKSPEMLFLSFQHFFKNAIARYLTLSLQASRPGDWMLQFGITSLLVKEILGATDVANHVLIGSNEFNDISATTDFSDHCKQIWGREYHTSSDQVTLQFEENTIDNYTYCLPKVIKTVDGEYHERSEQFNELALVAALSQQWSRPVALMKKTSLKGVVSPYDLSMFLLSPGHFVDGGGTHSIISKSDPHLNWALSDKTFEDEEDTGLANPEGYHPSRHHSLDDYSLKADAKDDNTKFFHNRSCSY